MPVYNTASSVVKAIESVRNQTDADWELLIVIDASPDDAQNVIARDLDTHPDARIHLITLAQNRGVSGARNAALEVARGEWLAFLDSDDCFEPQFLETLHRSAARSRSELAVCAHKVIATDGSERIRQRMEAGALTGREAVVALLHDSFTPYLWDKLINRGLVRNARFAEDIHRAEDALFVLQALVNAQKVVVVGEPLYRYSIDVGGLTWGRATPVEESDRLAALMTEAVGVNQRDGELRSALIVSKVLTYLNNAQQVLVAEPKNSRASLGKIRRRISFKEAGTCLKARPVFGAAAILLKVSPSLYRALYGAYIKRRYGVSMNSN